MLQLIKKRTDALIILKKHVEYMKLRRSETYSLIKKSYKNKQNQKLSGYSERMQLFGNHQKKKITSALQYEDMKRDPLFVVNTSILVEVIKFLHRIKKQTESYSDETYISEEKQSTSSADESIHFSALIHQYALLKTPFDEDPLLFRKIQGMTKEFWQTPSLKLMSKLYSFYKFFKDSDPQFKPSGMHNIWVIKPSSNSRGQGIYLVDRVEDVVDSGQKMQARIVQKYIERPLIFEGEKYDKLNGRKFDIRQWVLVSSMKPLKIYVFGSSYLRLCSQNYDLENIKQLSKHLTNFSLNKQNIKKEHWDETVMELKEFICFLKQFKNVDYHQEIKPQIKSLIIETLKCVQDKIVHRKNSFELYGFDILIDESFRPWLLEVNMSPACSERTPFLTNMLDAMALQMFQIIFAHSKMAAKCPDAKMHETLFQSEIENQGISDNPEYRWEEIYNEEDQDDFQIDDQKQAVSFNNDHQLIVIGQKADLKKEKAIDQKYFQHWYSLHYLPYKRVFCFGR